jgi:hypothetical protein
MALGRLAETARSQRNKGDGKDEAKADSTASAHHASPSIARTGTNSSGTRDRLET